MDRQFFYNEDIPVCEECGRQYSDKLTKCPYCEAERKAKLITKRGSYQSRVSLVAAILFVAVLIVGVWEIHDMAQEHGGWTIGQEYEAAAEKQQTVQAGITAQKSQLDSVETATVQEETEEDETDEEVDDETDEVSEEDSDILTE